MSTRKIGLFLATAATGFSTPLGWSGKSSMAESELCVRTAHSRKYSNAYYVEKAGDVVGYELALEAPNGKSITALLFVYEDVPNEVGIDISGQISDKKIKLEGKWVEHLTEHPSGKEIVETHTVTVDGTLDSDRFLGRISIEGLAAPTKVSLKRVDDLWMCKP